MIIVAYICNMQHLNLEITERENMRPYHLL